MNKNNEWSMREYVTIFSVYSLYTHYKKYRAPTKPIIYNKYISRAMTSIGNKTTLINIDITEIYYYMYSYFVNGDVTYLTILGDLTAKQLRLVTKGFTHFYHRNIKQSELKKIMNQ